MKKFILSFLAASSLFFGGMYLVANAAPITPVTGGGTGTSTIPANGAILIGNGTGYSFVQSSTFGGGGSSNLTSTYIGFGNASNVITGSSTFTTLSYDTIAYADQYAGADMEAKINAAYAALPSNGGEIFVPVNPAGGCWTGSTNIVFNTKGKLVRLVGAAGGGFYDSAGACIQYTGTSTMITVDTNNFVTGGSGIETLSLYGPAGTNGNIGSSTVSSTYAIKLGGSDTNGGAFGFQLDKISISGFGTGVYVGSNVSFFNMTNSYVGKNGQDIYEPQTTGANGENMRVTNSVIADSNNAVGSIAQYCVQVQQSGNIQWTFTGTSFDDCQFYSNQYGGTANINKFTNDHFENPNYAATGAYDFISGISGQAASQVIISQGTDYMNDDPSTAASEFVNNGGVFSSANDVVSLNGGVVNTPMTRFVTNQDANDIVSWKNLANNFGNTSAPSAVSNVFGTQGFSADGMGYGTNTLVYSISTSTTKFGNTVNFPNLTAGKFLALDGSGNLITTSTPSGGGGIASSTPFSSGYLSMASGTNNETNSNIFQFATSTYGPIVYVQSSSTQANCTNCSQDVTSTLNNVTAGDLLVLGFGNTIVVTSTFTDSNGTPVFISSTTWNGAGAQSYVYYEANAAAGTHNIHVHFPGFESYTSVWVTEYSGAATSSPLDSFAKNTGSGGATISSGNFGASALPNELIFGSAASAGGTISTTTGFTARDVNVYSEDNLPSTLGAGTVASATFGYNAGPGWVVIGATFKPTTNAATNDISVGTTTDFAKLAVVGNIYSNGILIGTTTAEVGSVVDAVGSNASSSNGTEIEVKNTASTSFSGFISVADNGTVTNNYGFVGINNSNRAAGSEAAGDVALEASSTGGVDIATQTSTIRLCVGGTFTTFSASCTKETIGTSTTVFNNNITASGTLSVSGTVNESSTETVQGAVSDRNYKGLVSLGTNASGTPLVLGTTTLSIGGGALALDACTSTTTVVPFVLNSSTDVFPTQPVLTINPAEFGYNTVLTSVQTGSSTLTTQVCTNLAAGATPPATKYLFEILRISGM